MEIKQTPDEQFATLQANKGKPSLMQKHLTEAVFKKYKDTKTKLGGTLSQCINSGSINLDSGTGLYACDPEAYDVFWDLFEPVIKEYHKADEVKHPQPEFGDINNLPFGDLDPEGQYVVSTRVRVGRSVDGMPFPPLVSKEQRKGIEDIGKSAYSSLEGDLAGEYISLETMTKEQQTQLIEDHFLFNDSDRFLREAGGYRDWPEARGIFFSKDKRFLSWCNEEDHFRIISMQMGGNLGEVYSRLVRGIEAVEKAAKKVTANGFAHHDKLGYLTFCPTNLGTTMRASVHVKVPKLSADKELFEGLCAKYNLQPRGIHGEHTESVGGVYDISNKRRLGLSEFQAVCEMAAGVKEVIAKEKSL